jgi:formamidopyrimidine-DNA glycosylase
MPELPEVETTLRGIEPHITHQKITAVTIRTKKLRWPIPSNLSRLLVSQEIESITRRAKYLLFHLQTGTLIIHLGMSGSLRITHASHVAEKHDHIDIQFNDRLLRYRDPRKFGAVLWTQQDPYSHKLLASLGPEPLDNHDFTSDYLYTCSRKRQVSIKEFIMNARIVVGVGNIYATEALFESGIHPSRAAGRVSKLRYDKLVDSIQHVLSHAITLGGTTLKDFTREDGKPGYFKNELKIYGRSGQACTICNSLIKTIKIGQRSSAYCPQCQH